MTQNFTKESAMYCTMDLPLITKHTFSSDLSCRNWQSDNEIMLPI